MKDRETLLAFRARLEANGVDVLGVTDHAIFHSVYFFDPNGHRIELACPDPEEEAKLARLDAVKWDMLREWSETKRGCTLDKCTRRTGRGWMLAPQTERSSTSDARAHRLGVDGPAGARRSYRPSPPRPAPGNLPRTAPLPSAQLRVSPRAPGPSW